MSTLVSTINTHLLTQIALALPTYTEINILYNIDSNAKDKLNNRYGSKPLASSEVDGVLGKYTMDHLFEITLTNSYKSSKLLSDSNKASVIITLQDAVHDVYQQFKRSSPSGVIVEITDLAMDIPEIDTDNKIIIQTMNVIVKYRNDLK